jgi:hypothetical protein
MNRNINLTFLFTVLFLKAFNTCSQNVVQDSYQFLSPQPGSVGHNPETSIIIRFGEQIDKNIIQSQFLEVEGEKSGSHTGKLILASDNKTLIFKPNKPFLLKENVRVRISKGIATVSGNYLPEMQYSFGIGDKINVNEDHAVVSEILPSGLFKAGEPTNKTMNVNSFITNPLITIQYSNDPSAGNLFTALGIQNNYYAYACDNEGIPVFVKQLPNRINNLKPNAWGTASFYDYSQYAYILIDNELNPIDTFKMGNGYQADMHEFLLLKNGHSFMIASDRQNMDMSSYVVDGRKETTVTGAVIQELDENKQVIFEWRTWDHFKITDSYEDLTNSTIDYAHCNSIDADTDTSIILSSRNLNEITRINKNTGALIWRMGGKNNQFQFINETRQFAGQHSVDMLDNGNIIFYDNGVNRVPEYSRGVEYQTDLKNKKVTLFNEFIHSTGKYVNVMGNIERLSNGNTLIYWGGAAGPVIHNFSEYDKDKKLVMEGELNNESLPTYRVYREVWEPSIFSLSADTLSFDETNIGQETTRQITLKNISGAERNITSIHIKNDELSALETMPVKLLPGEEKTFGIHYAPQYVNSNYSSIVFCSETEYLFISQKLIVKTKPTLVEGISSYGNDAFSVNPNPFSSTLTIRSPGSIRQITICDLNGKICYKSLVSGNQIQLKPKGLKKGIYILSAEFTDRTLKRINIVKQ